MDQQGRILHRKDEGRYYKGVPIHAAPGVHEAVFDIVQKYVSKYSSIMDLGGGSGAFTLRLFDCGYNAEIADLDPPLLPGIRSIRIDLNATEKGESLDGRSFDAVTALEVIEHLENPSAFIRRAGTFLKEDGVFIFTTPNVLDVDSRRLLLTKGEFWLFRRGTLYSTGHLSILPFWLLEDILKKEGWGILEKRFIGRKDRKGWRKIIVPIVNTVLLLLGWRLPIEAAFAPCVAFVCRRQIRNC